MTKPKWEILVINLAASTLRWQSITAKLAQLNLPFTRIDAVSGHTLDATALHAALDNKKAQQDYHYTISSGEVACYLSHLRAWQYIVDQQLDYAIVLEDDVEFDTNFVAALQELTTAPKGWHLIKLGGKHKPPRTTLVQEQGDFQWVRYRKPPIGAFAQAVSYGGAQQLLAQRPPVFRPVDVDIQWQHQLGIKVYGLLPYSVSTPNTHPSDINAVVDRRLQKRRPLNRIKHQILLYLDGVKASF